MLYNARPIRNPEYESMVVECLGSLLELSAVHVSIFAAESTGVARDVLPSSPFCGAGEAIPEAMLEEVFEEGEFEEAGDWLLSRLGLYILGETRGLGVAIVSGRRYG